MITQVSANEVLTTTREQLGIPQSAVIDDTLLAAMLRRAAGIHFPLRAALKSATSAAVSRRLIAMDALVNTHDASSPRRGEKTGRE